MTSKGSKSRIKWEGDSLKEIQSWPKNAKENLGGDLNRLERNQEPLDAGYLKDGISELRERDKDFWYRVLYTLYSGWIYVLYCFKKKTNKTPQEAIDLALKRFNAAKERDARSKGEKSA